MRINYFLVFLLIVSIFVSCNSGSKSDSKWQLVWSDEFDGEGLVDESKWSYEEGFVRNNEPQYYTRAQLKNCRQENGYLILEAHKEQVANPKYNPESDSWKESREYAGYSSASLHSLGKFEFLYGRVEASVKVPHGTGVWPAFWTKGAIQGTGVPWPKCGEIDILEYFSGERPNRIESNTHYSVHDEYQHRQGVVDMDTPPEGFHIYAFEWYEDRIDFYFDDKLYWSFDVNEANDDNDYNAYRLPQFVILNLALGNGSNAAGPIDDSLFPAQYYVDYVRYYKLKENK